MELPLMQQTIFSQAMRTSAYQTWSGNATFTAVKGTEAMLGFGSIVDCGNSANNPLPHPRPLSICA